MGVRGEAGVRREVHGLAAGATDPVGLQRDVVRAVSRAVPSDAFCVMTLDPASVLPTGGYHEEGLPPERLPALLDVEYGAQPDVHRMSDMARGAAPVAARLSDGLGPDPAAASPRWREVLAPSGLPHELRVVLRDGSTAWGALVLMREASSPDFGDDEVRLLGSLAADAAAGVRRAMVVTDITERDDPGAPGLLLLRPRGAGLEVQHEGAALRHWLAQVVDDEVDGVPVAVQGVAQRARLAGAARSRLRTRAGTWLTVHAERLGTSSDDLVQVVVSPSRPLEVAAVVADAYGLTPREVEVVLLVARGCSNDEVARLLVLSPWTVQDHLRSAYAKTGTRSRSELTSRLLFDQYLPRQHAGAPLGAQGWFLPVPSTSTGAGRSGGVAAPDERRSR